MRLSAIVPTHERPTLLARCVETLVVQDVGAGELEVVVVDDGSQSDIASVVAQSSANSTIPVRCERQEMTGLNGARNRGVGVATGDVLAFLDDDTLVSPGWARALLRAFDSYPCAAVGGRVELRLDGPEPAWLPPLRSFLAEYDLGAEGRWLDDDPVPVGANCAVRRSEFDRLGGFAPGLDRIGGSLVSNGDTEFFRRLRASGARLRYEPQASVIHCVPAERLTVDYFIKRHRAQGISDELLLKLGGQDATFGHRLALARSQALTARRLAIEVLRGRGTLGARFEFHYWAGRRSAARVTGADAARAGADTAAGANGAIPRSS